MSWSNYVRRLSYASSDTAGQLVFCVISFYLLKFYTDVFGLSAAVAGTILLAARCVDAVDTPVWGIIFDKTHSRWGKSRPWFLWLCVPFAVFGVLTFMTPDWSYHAKIAYAAGTYVICSVLYTGINTPVTSILSALTPDSRERATLNSFRMFGSKLGVLIVNYSALKMVAWLGQGNDRKGFMLVMPIYACGSILLYLFAFWNLREVVHEVKKSQPISASFKAIVGNWPWIIIFISSLCFWIAFIARVSLVPFYLEYTLHRKDLVPVANTLDFISLTTVLLLPFFCRWTSKRTAWVVGLLGMILGQVIIWLTQLHGISISWFMVGWAFGFLFSGMAMAMPFLVLSDSVDYGEWKTGIRAAGFLTAIGAAFCLKAGAGLGGALPAYIMQYYGYEANVPQTASSLRGIELGFIWLPVLFFLLSIIPVLFYKKYELMEPQIQSDLRLRRTAAESKA
jgi:sugar (glycoside-pentoside-hexuronide) transporter